MDDHKPEPYPDGDDGLLEYGLWQLEKDRLSSQNISPEMLARIEQQLPTRTRLKLNDVFTHPDLICSSEYRAIYDCLADALSDYGADEHADVCAAMLDEFIEQAQGMKNRLKQTLNGNVSDRP